MTEEGQGQRPWSDSAAEFVASRRNVLRTATGLAAAAVVGTALADRERGTMAAAGGVNRISCQIGDLGPFEVLSFSWGAANPASIGSSGGGAGSGKVQLQDLTLTKNVDVTTPELFMAVATGKHFDQATLTTIDASGKTGLSLTMKLVFVSEDQINGSEGATSGPTENVTLSFGAIEVEFQNDSHSWDATTGNGT